MSRHQPSGVITYQEGHGLHQVHRWCAFAVLAVSFFMTVADGHYWAHLAGPFVIVGIGTAFAFIPVSIAALAGVTEHQAGLASGLLNTSQQLGGAIGVAIASTIAATHASTLLHHDAAPAAALTSGFQWAFWACGAIGLAAVPITYLLVRRDELNKAVASTTQKPQPAPAKL
jgi:Na+/melibiose symporter-like transporter